MFKKCYEKISPKSTKEMMSANTDTLLLDVRENHEHKSGHIKQSKNIPVGQINYMTDHLPSSKETPIIIYCLSGIRAKTACKMLFELGYTNLYNLGGINVWPYGIVR